MTCTQKKKCTATEANCKLHKVHRAKHIVSVSGIVWLSNWGEESRCFAERADVQWRGEEEEVEAREKTSRRKLILKGNHTLDITLLNISYLISHLICMQKMCVWWMWRNSLQTLIFYTTSLRSSFMWWKFIFKKIKLNKCKVARSRRAHEIRFLDIAAEFLEYLWSNLSCAVISPNSSSYFSFYFNSPHRPAWLFFVFFNYSTSKL